VIQETEAVRKLTQGFKQAQTSFLRLITQARVETSPSTVVPISRHRSQNAGQHLLLRR